MKKIIKYFIVSLFFMLLFYFTITTVNTPPDYLSDQIVSLFTMFKNIIDKPLQLFSLVFSDDYVKEHSTLFYIIEALFFAYPVSLFLSNSVSDKNKKFDLQNRPGVLVEFEYVDKEKKSNVYPITKKDKFLNNIGMLKNTSLEKEIFYNVSFSLPTNIRDVFASQVRSIKRIDRVEMIDDKKEYVYFINFDSITGNVKLKHLFSDFMFEGNSKEFVLATVVFKDKNYTPMFANVWVKNKKLNKIVFQWENEFVPDKDYDFTVSMTKISNLVKDL